MTCCGVFPHDDDIASIMDRVARNFAEKAPVFPEPIPPRLHLRLCTLLGYLFRSPSVQYSIISTQNDSSGGGQAFSRCPKDWIPIIFEGKRDAIS